MRYSPHTLRKAAFRRQAKASDAEESCCCCLCHLLSAGRRFTLISTSFSKRWTHRAEPRYYFSLSLALWTPRVFLHGGFGAAIDGRSFGFVDFSDEPEEFTTRRTRARSGGALRLDRRSRGSGGGGLVDLRLISERPLLILPSSELAEAAEPTTHGHVARKSSTIHLRRNAVFYFDALCHDTYA